MENYLLMKAQPAAAAAAATRTGNAFQPCAPDPGSGAARSGGPGEVIQHLALNPL